MRSEMNLSANRIFSRFSPFIRDYIYQSGWDELRRVQIDAAEKIFFSDDNLLISSETASGKTEAALFPILTLMEDESPEQFQVLYISPLKALINDQYSRMETLLKESNLPVYRWHGDVAQSQKAAYLKNPRGLLQITPESLESLICRRNYDISRIFSNLKFVIIDEVHWLMGTDRGNQILCQLQRIARLISYTPRRIALSATIGGSESAAAWLGGGSGRETSVIHIPAKDLSWKLGLEHFLLDKESLSKPILPPDEFIYRATRGDSCVVFSNSREETEEICSTLRQIAKRKNEEDRFYIHHGNLSASIREETESALKSEEKRITACATVTLELGIDIGRLRRIINQGAPASVSGFLQRLGRSGRRGLPPEMLMVFREEEATPLSPLFQQIPWELIQAIAICNLYLNERWLEPAENKPKPASLLFHQTLSILSAKGALTPKALAQEVLSLSPFTSFSKEEYKELLIHMLRQDFIEKTDENELIVGLRGEKLTNSFKFFAVFKDSEDFSVHCGSEEIGTVSTAPPVGERFALAGRVWEVEEIDAARRLIYCKKVDGKMKISWPGDAGIIHTRIFQEMRHVLSDSTVYPYLLPGASQRLEAARTLAKKTGLCEKVILSLGGNSFVLFPWLGTKAFQTLKRLLQQKIGPELGLFDIQSGGGYYLTFKSDISRPEDVLCALKMHLSQSKIEEKDLVVKTEYPVSDKFDANLPQSLLLQSFAENRLCLDEVKKAFK